MTKAIKQWPTAAFCHPSGPDDAHGRPPLLAADDDIAEFTRLATKGLSSWKMAPIFGYIMDEALGNRGLSAQLLLSNGRIRGEATSQLCNELTRLWKEKSRHRWFFITLLDDRGNALEYDSVIDFSGLRERFERAYVAIGLNTVGFIELQAWTNFPQGGAGRTLGFHTHALGWTTDPHFDAKEVARRISRSNLLRNSFRAKTVSILPLPPVLRQLHWRAYYMLKAPADGKYVRRDGATASGWSLGSTGIREDLAVRVFESLTQLTFQDVALATGDGVALQQAWYARLLRWHTHELRRLPLSNSAPDYHELWAQLRKGRRGIARSSIRFEPAPEKPFTLWERAARQWFESRPDTRRHVQRGRPRTSTRKV